MLKENTFTAPWNGSGTEDDPYLIEDVGDLKSLRNRVDEDGAEGLVFMQTTDLDLTEALEEDASGEKTWIPIGNAAHPFEGSYNGKNQDGKVTRMKGLVIRYSASYYLGLFGYLGKEGCLKNVYVENAEVEADGKDTQVGILAGGNYGCIENCGVTIRSMTADGIECAGGIAGFSGINGKGKIKKCFVFGNITVSNDTPRLGGIAGNNSGEISSCCYQGTLEGNTSDEFKTFVGGIAGETIDKITDTEGNYVNAIKYCYSIGTILGKGNNIGGICGKINNSENMLITAFYLKSHIQEGNGIGTGMTLREMLSDDFCNSLNEEQKEKSFLILDSQQGVSFVPVLGIQKEVLEKEVLYQSASALELEEFKISLKENTANTLLYSWRVCNGAECELIYSGKKEDNLPTEITGHEVETENEDYVKGELVMKNPWCPDLVCGYSYAMPPAILEFSAKIVGYSKPRLFEEDAESGFLELKILQREDRIVPYVTAFKKPPTPPTPPTPPSKPRIEYSWKVHRALKINLKAGNEIDETFTEAEKKVTYSTYQRTAVLTVIGKDGQEVRKTVNV